MEYIICYTIAMYGITNLLVYGSGPFNILTKFRDFCDTYITTVGEMLKCMMCTSTNIGIICSVIDLVLLPNVNFTPFNILYDNAHYWWFIAPLDACFTSGVVWLLHTIQEALERWNNA